MAYTNATTRPAIIEFVLGLAEQIREARARRRTFNTTVHELSMLSDRDLSDLGIARANIAEIARAHAYGA